MSDSDKVSSYNLRRATKRLNREVAVIAKDPMPGIDIRANENNILEWHFVIHGKEDTPYQGGFYHGKLIFPPNFPFNPPQIRFLTPNGRFKTNERISFSLSDFHPEEWKPAYSVMAVLQAVTDFMHENTETIGSIETSESEKIQLAEASEAYNAKDEIFCRLFPQLCGRELESENSSGESSPSKKNPDLVREKTPPLSEAVFRTRDTSLPPSDTISPPLETDSGIGETNQTPRRTETERMEIGPTTPRDTSSTTFESCRTPSDTSSTLFETSLPYREISLTITRNSPSPPYFTPMPTPPISVYTSLPGTLGPKAIHIPRTGRRSRKLPTTPNPRTRHHRIVRSELTYFPSTQKRQPSHPARGEHPRSREPVTPRKEIPFHVKGIVNSQEINFHENYARFPFGGIAGFSSPLNSEIRETNPSPIKVPSRQTEIGLHPLIYSQYSDGDITPLPSPIVPSPRGTKHKLDNDGDAEAHRLPPLAHTFRRKTRKINFAFLMLLFLLISFLGVFLLALFCTIFSFKF